MRKLLRGGHGSVTRAFADNCVERVVIMRSVNPQRSEFVSFRRAGIRASSYSGPGVPGRHGEHLATLGLDAAASRQEIKQAYRKLALKYHPDVCKGDHCALMFKQVNNAYEVALEAEEEEEQESMSGVGDECLDGFMGATDDSWEDWEEWMGWEGAGSTDYSSHINPSFSF